MDDLDSDFWSWLLWIAYERRTSAIAILWGELELSRPYEGDLDLSRYAGDFDRFRFAGGEVEILYVSALGSTRLLEHA